MKAWARVSNSIPIYKCIVGAFDLEGAVPFCLASAILSLCYSYEHQSVSVALRCMYLTPYFPTKKRGVSVSVCYHTMWFWWRLQICQRGFLISPPFFRMPSLKERYGRKARQWPTIAADISFILKVSFHKEEFFFVAYQTIYDLLCRVGVSDSGGELWRNLAQGYIKVAKAKILVVFKTPNPLDFDDLIDL